MPAVPGQHPGAMVNGEGAVGVAQGFHPLLLSWQRRRSAGIGRVSPSNDTVILAHRSCKLFAEHIVQQAGFLVSVKKALIESELSYRPLFCGLLLLYLGLH